MALRFMQPVNLRLESAIRHDLSSGTPVLRSGGRGELLDAGIPDQHHGDCTHVRFSV